MKKFSTDRDKLEQILKFSMLDKAKLGRKIGVENQELYQIANGKQSEFSRSTMVKLVKIFPEISPYWLITGEGSMLSGSIEHHNADATALRWKDIDGDTLRIVTQKTADRISIPLNAHAAAIIGRYRILRTTYPLPHISNQQANKHLKDAALLANLDRETVQTYYRGAQRMEERLAVFEAITTHWARRTFVVHALRLGIPAEVVMQFTGHR